MVSSLGGTVLDRVRDTFLEPLPAAAEAAGGAADATAPARLVLASAIAAAGGSRELAAAVAVSAAGEGRGVLLLEAGDGPTPRPTLLASWEARLVEEALADPAAVGPVLRHRAARGMICRGLLGPEPPEATALLALRALPCLDLIVVHAVAGRWREMIDCGGIDPDAVLLRAELPRDRAQAALVSRELQARGIRIRVAAAAPGPVGGRRALAGLDPSGAGGRRAVRLARALGAVEDESGQALPLALGAIAALLAATVVLVAFGAAVTAKGRMQRAADLAAVSAARSMRDDHRRLFVRARDHRGRPDPRHLGKDAYLRRAAASARRIARANGAPPGSVTIRFPDGGSLAPVRTRVALELEVDGARTSVDAEAIAAPAPVSPQPAVAAGGGYSGPLAYRQGKPMRPDVARAFDRLAAAARAAGVALAISSGYRSDVEQARLYAANPDPRWVAPPGRSLHRCGTELDLGPAAAYGWLAANAPRFGFTKRYSWEPWHLGFVRGPAPCSAASERVGGRRGDGAGAARGGLPGFVPARYRAALSRAASRHGVSAGLLAAQLLAESNFNPFAVSPAGARGIAQFMPATAAAYGLRDPFDAAASIDAQARLMADLLARFVRTDLALAAYNAGPSAVETCSCADPYAETAAYVSRILGLLGGAGESLAVGGPPALEVRLVD